MSLASCQRRYSAGAINGSAGATDLARWQVELASEPIHSAGATDGRYGKFNLPATSSQVKSRRYRSSLASCQGGSVAPYENKVLASENKVLASERALSIRSALSLDVAGKSDLPPSIRSAL